VVLAQAEAWIPKKKAKDRVPKRTRIWTLK